MPTTLSPEQEEFVSQKIATGRFADADAVLNEALRLLEVIDHDDPLPIDELRREIELGTAAMARGEFQRFDQEGLAAFFEQIKTEGRKRLAQNQHKAAS